MPDELIERLDAHAADHDYTVRSEVVRESARTLLAEFDDTRLEDEPLAGVVTVFYDFGTQHVERRVTDLRHEYDDHIAVSDHSYVADYCADQFILETGLTGISGFIGSLRAIEDLGAVDYSLVPLDAVGQLRDA